MISWTALEVKRDHLLKIILCTLIIAIVFASPANAGYALIFAVENLISITPIMMVGLMMTAIMAASNSMQLIASVFKGREITMIMCASMIGAISPVCGATVLPLVAGLLLARVPIASIMAFWLSSPITDPAMLSLTGATLGWSFAIAKTLGAILVGIFGGMTTLALTRLGFFQYPIKSSSYINRISESVCGSERPILWQFWKEQERVLTFQTTVISTAKLMLTWLTLAFIAEYYLNRFVPLEWLTTIFREDNVWAIPIAAIVGAPIYLDGYAALPLIRSLMDAGMRPDAALTFLVAGGITSTWAALPVYALVRNSLFALYLILALLSSMLVGWTAGLLL